MKTVGIIGFGRFGQLAARYLAPHFNVYASSKSDHSADAKRVGATFTTIEECAKKDFVLVTVPISAFRETIQAISPFVRKDALVFDACSVKEEPVQAMKELLPNCECIGTHPLFGPDSAADSLVGRKIVLCQIRSSRFEKVTAFLESLGLEVIIATPEEHDKQIAESLGIAYFIGKALNIMESDKLTIVTPSYVRLLELARIVRNDSGQLFNDVHTRNRFAKGARRSLISELERIDAELKR